MSQFVVSARKYRPQRFDEVVGQEHVSKTLKNALQNDQLAHAFLFCTVLVGAENVPVQSMPEYVLHYY